MGHACCRCYFWSCVRRVSVIDDSIDDSIDDAINGWISILVFISDITDATYLSYNTCPCNGCMRTYNAFEWIISQENSRPVGEAFESWKVWFKNETGEAYSSNVV